MAVERQQNWQPQQRIDIPHLRALEAGVAGDLDVLVGQMMAGVNPFVVSGFDTVPPIAGTPATSVQINVVSGRICHPLASESGTIFSVPAGRTVETLNVSNARVRGSFTASATNYVGLDLLRSADDTTTDLLQILDADTLLETPKEAPLARTLDYVLVISNQDFATTPNVAPLVKVVTDANNNVVSVEDARNLMFRLGKGGGVTQPLYTYPWAGGRTEVGNNTDFNAGDKVIASFKDWMDAAMTRVWEVGGGEHWYSATSDRNVQLVRNGTTLFTNGDYFEWSGTNLHWRELRFIFPNSTGSFNDVADQLTDSAGLTDLADGQCVYVDIDRTTNRTGGTALVAAKATTLTLGTPTVPGSRYILAWRVGSNIYTRGNSYAVGTTFNPATTSVIGMVKLSVTPGAPSAPVVFNPDVNGGLTVTATGGNATGTTSTGNGSGSGVSAQGGGAGGIGVVGTGGAGGGGYGGYFQGGSAAAGIVAVGGTNSSPGGQFTGGAVGGAGILVTGTGAGVGIDVTGGSSGSAVVAHGVAGNDAPIVAAKDLGGNLKFAVDHIGYPMGQQRIEIRELWLQPTFTTASGTNVIVPNNPRWLYKLGASGSINGQGADTSGILLPAITFSLASGVSNQGFLYTACKIFAALGTDWAVAAETTVFVNHTINASITCYIGFCDNADPTSAASGGNAMWITLNNGNVTAQVIGAGVVIGTASMGTYTDNNILRFRIEQYRAGGTAKFRCWMNGVVTEISGATAGPIGQASHFHASIFKNVADGLTATWTVGPVLINYGNAITI